MMHEFKRRRHLCTLMNETDSAATLRSGKSGSMAIKILAIIASILMLLSIYNVVQISTMQDQLRSLESQNSFQQSQLANLQGQLNGVESQLSSLTQGSSSVKFAVKATFACLSVYDQQKCDGTFVYFIGLTNIGTRTI